MPLDLDVAPKTFSVRAAYYCVKACELAYLADMSGGFTDFGLGGLAKSFHLGDLSGFVGITPTYSLVAFRGTDSIATWLVDGRAFQLSRRPYLGRVHRGFADALDAIWPGLVRDLPTDRPVFVTGHSLGGALATLAGYRLTVEGKPVRAVYTFGSPRVGNGTFFDGYGVANYRFVNNNDLVPHVPFEFMISAGSLADLQVFGVPLDGLFHFIYKHVGTFKYLDENGRLSDDVSEWETKKRLVKSRFVDDGGHIRPEASADHHIFNYVSAMRSNLPAGT